MSKYSPPCYVVCFTLFLSIFLVSRSVSNLKIHLMSRKHGWSKEKAESARINFGLNLTRKRLPNEKRKTKPQKFSKRICPLGHCHKEVRRLDNHLRQFHKLPGQKIRRKVQEAEIVLSDRSSSSKSEEELSTSSDDSDFEGRISALFSADSLYRENIYEDDSDESDDDWLLSNYINVKTKQGDSYRKSQMDSNNLKKAAGSSMENCEISSETDTDTLDENIDYADLPERFFMTSGDDDKILESFVQWSCGPDGSYKPLRTAKDRKNTVVAILKHDDSTTTLSFGKLLDKYFLESWVNKCHEKGMQPGTIRTYLNSVISFYDFCEVTHNKVIEVSEVGRMRTIIRKWMSALHKQIAERSYEKQLEDLDKLPTATELTTYDNSNAVKEAVKLLKQALVKKMDVTRKEFCLMRNYLITVLILDNASRSGAIANMTMREFRTVRASGDGHIIGVIKHKTGYKGPAFLSLTDEILHLMNMYVNHVRSNIDGISCKDEDPVFVSWSGKQMASSMVIEQFNRFWEQATGNSNRITTTLVRKMATTKIRRHNPELATETANMLCHSETTAAKSYHLYDKAKNAFTTSRHVKQVLRNTLSPEKTRKVKYSADPEVTVNNHLNVPEEISESNKLSDQGSDPNILPPSSPCGSTSLLRQRNNFTEEETGLINELFGNIVRGKECIGKETVKNLFKKEPRMKPLVKKFGLRSLLVKLRTERSKLQRR